MNCFKLVKSVLDEQYGAIPGKEAEKDKAIREGLDYLGKCYARLRKDECKVNYADPAIRFAYIYRYVTAHADYVCSLIGSTVLNKLLDAQKLNISCIGGGPGSDLVGVLKCVEAAGKTPTLRFTLLDREKSWNESWYDVGDKLATSLPTNVNFLPFDVTDKKSWEPHRKYLNSDLFTLIYFVSETFAFREKAAPYYADLFDHAAKGAYFLYIDNDASSFSDWFDGLWKGRGIKLIEGKSVRITTDPQEERTDLGEYWKKFGYPKLQAEIAYRVLQKQ
jgi:thiol-disulfide isomerase/thioredoxin